MTCSECDDRGYVSPPWIVPDLFSMIVCTCLSGDRFRALITILATPIPEDEE